MKRAIDCLLDLLFPPKCVFCGKLLDLQEEGLCAACRRDLPWLEGAAAEQTLEGISLCVSPLRYCGSVRDSLRRYKFQGCRGYHRAYGPLLARCIQTHLEGRYDLITWAPLSARRKRERGYDQAYLLASAAARALGTTAVPLLRKVKHTAAQSGLEEDDQRRSNVLGVYAPFPPAAAAGKRILLVDDIVTTGSTLVSCAKVLREAGAADVVCAAVARAR